MTDLITAAKSGDRRETLVAMRDLLAETIQSCDNGRDMASNTKRLMDVMSEIELIDNDLAIRAKETERRKGSKYDRLRRKIDNVKS